MSKKRGYSGLGYFSEAGMERLRKSGSINYRKGLGKRTKAERRKWGSAAGLKASSQATPQFYEMRGKRVAKSVEKRWSLRAPNGVHFSFVNLRRFIRENSDLFSAEQLLVDKNGRPRAVGGISGLRPTNTRKRVKGSWHGWTWRGDFDGVRIESVYGR